MNVTSAHAHKKHGKTSTRNVGRRALIMIGLEFSNITSSLPEHAER